MKLKNLAKIASLTLITCLLAKASPSLPSVLLGRSGLKPEPSKIGDHR